MARPKAKQQPPNRGYGADKKLEDARRRRAVKASQPQQLEIGWLAAEDRQSIEDLRTALAAHTKAMVALVQALDRHAEALKEATDADTGDTPKRHLDLAGA